MDITPVFETVILGSNPSGCTIIILCYNKKKRVWFSGRMRPCQGRDESSILSIRTTLRS